MNIAAPKCESSNHGTRFTFMQGKCCVKVNLRLTSLNFLSVWKFGIFLQLTSNNISCEQPGNRGRGSCLVLQCILLLWKFSQTLRGCEVMPEPRRLNLMPIKCESFPRHCGFCRSQDVNEVFKSQVWSSHHPSLQLFFPLRHPFSPRHVLGFSWVYWPSFLIKAVPIQTCLSF